MKKLLTILLAVFLCACTEKPVSSKRSESSSQDYQNRAENASAPDSYFASVMSSYVMQYSDDTKDLFQMDGTFKVMNADSDPAAETTQNISANGVNSRLSGRYYKGRLYNTYNNVNYYEDMSLDDLKKSMLVPMSFYAFPQEQISSLDTEMNGDQVRYDIILNDQDAGDIFASRYDSYGLKDSDGYKVTKNRIRDIFDQDGNFVSEKTEFDVEITVSGQKVSITFTSSLSYMDLNKTKVSISDEQKQEDQAYIAYTDLKPEEITSEGLLDDSEEATVEATFRKRLVERIGYQDEGNGVYSDSFNENEEYIVDFNAKTFQYRKYSLTYTYNWKNDTAAMNACTFNFAEDRQSDDCEDSVIQGMKDTRDSLEMELYYCGLSLEDLQKESQ